MPIWISPFKLLRKSRRLCSCSKAKKQKITTDCFAYSTFGLGSQIMKLLCLADEGSNSLRFSNSKVKSHHRFYGFYRLKHIKSVTSVVSVVKKSPQIALPIRPLVSSHRLWSYFVLLTKEATHHVSLLSKKNHHRFYGCYRLSQVKSVTSVVSVVKIHHIVLLTKEATHYVSLL